MSTQLEVAPPRLGMVVTTTSFGFALVQLDVTIVNVALPHIGADLGTGIAGLQWVIDAYALVFACLLLTAGFLGDRYGARKVYLAGLAVFGIASLICGLAGTAAGLIVGRTLQGVGAAAMVPASLTLLNNASGHDPRLRAWAIGWWTAAGSITIAAGPIVGGLLIGASGWRSIFLVNLPICAIGAWMSLRMPETSRKTATDRGFDPAGQILSIVALGSLIAAVIEAKPLGLGHPLVMAGFALSIAATVAFVAAEARVKAPMLPLSLFRAPGYAACVTYGTVTNVTFYGMVFVLSLYLQEGLHYGPVAAGLAYLPLTATFFVVNVLNGPLVGRFGARPPMVVGALVDAFGFALLLRLDLSSSYLAMLVPFTLMPAGMGTGIPAATTTVLAGTAKEKSGIATAALMACRQAGGAIGVACFGALTGDGGHTVVAGLHASAIVAIILLVVIACLAAVAIPARR